METKKCPKCNTEKDVTEFHKNKKTGDGLNCYCKECTTAAQRKGYAEKKAEPIPTRAAENNGIRILTDPDFADYPEHFDWLAAEAKRNFRTPKMQLIYMIDQAMGEEE